MFGKTMDELKTLFPNDLVEHNPRWSEWYEEEKQSIMAMLGDKLVSIDHYGSTSIPGLAAKPIIDILLQVATTADVTLLKSSLSGSGWLIMSEHLKTGLHLMLCKGYTSEGYGERVFHLHVRHPGDWNELYFRDYLIAHPDIAEEYADLKRTLVAQHRYDRNAYAQGKQEFVRLYTAKGREDK